MQKHKGKCYMALLVIAAFLAAAATAYATVRLAGDGIIRDESGGRAMVIGGTLRCCPWATVDDAAHDPINLAARGVNGRIRVTYPSSSAVVALVVTPDETLVQRGYSAGASVTRSSATIKCARYGRAVDCRELAGTSSNLWVMGIMRMGASS
jgi:hypothetical protein